MIKYGISIAVLALIGEVSAIELTHHHLEKPSDEVANGDRDDDRQLEDEDDPRDPIVDDNGFTHQWIQKKLIKDHDRHLALAQQQIAHKHHHKKHHQKLVQHRHHHTHHKQVARQNKHHHSHHHQKYSDDLANGDPSDDNRPEQNHLDDHIVDDNGFVNQFNYLKRQHVTAKNLAQQAPPMKMAVRKQPQSQQKAKVLVMGKNGKYSDELANGDKDDDKELENEDDARDAIVDDNGFTHQWAQRESIGLQLDDKLRMLDDGPFDYGYSQATTIYNKVLAGDTKGMQASGAFSQQLSNGDILDDVEVDDHDSTQNNDDFDFIQLDSQVNIGKEKQMSKGQQQHGSWWSDIQSMAKEKRDTDNMLIQMSDDVGDNLDAQDEGRAEVVDENGHTNAGYGSSKSSDFFDKNHILPGSHITVPRGDNILGNNAHIMLSNLRV